MYLSGHMPPKFRLLRRKPKLATRAAQELRTIAEITSFLKSSARRAPLAIDGASFSRQRLGIHFFWLIHDYIAAAVRKTERNAKQVFQSRSKCLTALRRYKEQHETASTGT